jgi:hypothetical protein
MQNLMARGVAETTFSTFVVGPERQPSVRLAIGSVWLKFEMTRTTVIEP